MNLIFSFSVNESFSLTAPEIETHRISKVTIRISVTFTPSAPIKEQHTLVPNVRYSESYPVMLSCDVYGRIYNKMIKISCSDTQEQCSVHIFLMGSYLIFALENTINITD